MATGETVTKTGGRKNEFAGFYVDKIDGDVIRSYVLQRKIQLDTDVDDQQLALALAFHFEKRVPADRQVRCDNCQAISDEGEESCPFCGDVGEIEEEEDGAVASAEESAPEVSSLKDDDDDADEEEAEDEEESDDEEDEDSAGSTDDDEEDEEEEDEVEVAAAPPKKEVAKMSEETIHVNGANGASKKAHGAAALAKTKPGKLSAGDLDKAVARVEKLKGEGYVNYWKLGQEILAINAEQLWKLRVDENGKQKYKSFDAFVHHELHMSPTHAYNAIEVAKNYDTPEEIRELGGTSKAVLILKAAEKDQPKLREKAKAGATKRELEKDVAASRKKNGAPKQSQQAKAGKAGKVAQQKAKPLEKITVANITGTRTIKLYKKPASMKGVEWPPAKRAKTVGDQPFGRLELQPGVVQWFSVIVKDGELVLNIQTVREG